LAGKEDGGAFEIIVNGKTRLYRHQKATAIEARKYLKDRYRQSAISLRDIRDSSLTVIAWENGAAFIRA